jgi:hypothetical protein
MNTFHITVHPIAHVHSCATKRAEEARGLYGFHQFTSCPDCQVTPDGFELWGENGHMQGRYPDDGRLLESLACKQRVHGHCRLEFAAGRPIYYVGTP